MKRNLKYLFVIVISSLLWGGCCSVRHTAQWEYKVAEPSGNTRQVIEPFLNDMAKTGWIFIEKDSVGWYYFKRVKR